MDWFKFFLMLLIALIGFLAFYYLTHLPRSLSFRYKLTLTLDTPEGVKTGSSVIEEKIYEVSNRGGGSFFEQEGEAVYVDLGVNHPPLIALLTGSIKEQRSREWIWRDGGPSHIYLLKLYGLKRSGPSDSDMDGKFTDYEHLLRQKGARDIPPADLPDLVTFTNIEDRKSITEVSPDDLQVTLGPGIAWHSATFEFTQEPVTRSLESRLPFLKSWTCANRVQIHASSVPSGLDYWSFTQWFDYIDKSGNRFRRPEIYGQCPQHIR